MVAGALFGQAKALVAFWIVLLELVAAIFVLRATRRVDPVWIVCIALILIPVQWHELGVPISPHRLLLPAALIVLALRMPGARHRHNFEFRLPHAALAIAGLYAILSAVSAGDLFSKAPFYALLDNYGLLAFLMFLAAPVIFHSDRNRGYLIGFMVGLGAYLGILAILETAHLWALVWPKYISNPSVGIHFGRARGPFVQAGDDGVAMFECAVMAVLGYIRWRGWRRFVCGSVAALCALGVLLTQTRGAWIAAGAGALVTLVAFKPLRAYLLPIALTLLIGLGGVLVAAPGLRAKITGRTTDQGPIWVRQTLNAASFRMIEARPLLGFGWGTFKKVDDPYIRQGPTYPIAGADEPDHNAYLSIAVELGLLGAIIWAIAVLASLGTAVLRRGPPELYQWRIAACAMAVSWLAAGLFGPAPYSFEIIVTFMVAGIAYGLRNPRVQWPEPLSATAVAADVPEAETVDEESSDWGFDDPVTNAPARPLEIAFLTTVLPDGLTTGAEVVSQSFISALRGAGHHVLVVGYNRPGESVGDKNVLSAGTRPADTAGASLLDRGGWARAAMRLKVPFSVARFESERYTIRARELLADPAIDLVVVDGADMGWLVPELKGADKRIVFISHGPTAPASADGSGTAAQMVAARESKLMSQVERSLVNLAAEVWTVSADEAARLGRHVRSFAAPGSVDVGANGHAPRPGFDVGLIGNWSSRSNSESLRWFVDQVVPLLPAETSVHVAGPGVNGIGGKESRVVVRGFVPNAREFVERARVIAVPAVASPGLQVRAVDAIAAGGWVVASSLALRGIVSPPVTVGVADAPDAFAAEIAAGLVIAPEPQARAEALLWASARRAAFDAAVAEAAERLAGDADQVPI
jgi:O-antigen ligase